MTKLAKCTTAALLALLLISMIVMTTAVYAQDDEDESLNPAPPPPVPPYGASGVIMLPAAGGTTNPTPGTYFYTNSSTLTLIATPYQGFRFLRWVIQGSTVSADNVPPIYLPDNETDITGLPPPAQYGESTTLTLSSNPLYMLCGYGYTYSFQPVFEPVALVGTGQALVIILNSIGGTSNPKPGTYTYTSETEVTLTATASEGYTFQYWVAKTADDPHLILVENPTLIHTPSSTAYSYQAIFAPTGSNIAGIPTETFYIVVAVLVVLVVVATAFALYMRSKQTQTPK